VPTNPAGGKEQKAQDEAGSQTTKKDGEAEFGLDGGGDDTDERPEQAKNQTFAHHDGVSMEDIQDVFVVKLIGKILRCGAHCLFGYCHGCILHYIA